MWTLFTKVWVAIWEATLLFWKLYFKEIDSWSSGQCPEVILSRCKIKLIASQFHMLIQIRSPGGLLGGHRCMFGSCRDWGLLLTMELLRERFAPITANWHLLSFKWTKSQRICPDPLWPGEMADFTRQNLWVRLGRTRIVHIEESVMQYKAFMTSGNIN